MRPWEDGTDSVEMALKRVEVAFEFMSKLGVDFYCFHDRDVAPEGQTLAESNKNLDAVAKALKEQQQKTGIKLLWGTANLFSNKRYVHGASTSCNAEVFAFAGAQVKKALEVTKDLGGENYVFWGGREGYSTLLNTDMKRELDHLASFFHMAVDYKKKIGFTGQFLIEPKPKEPTSHQYDFDAAACLNFLRQYDLTDHLKLNLETNHATLAGHSMLHEMITASSAGMLGSVDANRGDLMLGWDTDQFPTDLYLTTSHHAGSDGAGRHRAGRAELRRQGEARELRAGRSVPRPHRRHGRLRQGAEDRGQDPPGRDDEGRDQEALCLVGHGHRRADREGRGDLRGTGEAHAGEGRRRAPTRQAGKRCWRTCSTAMSRRRSGRHRAVFRAMLAPDRCTTQESDGVDILVADDDPTYRALTRGLLKAWGRNCILASSGAEAWEIIAGHQRPLLAILDWSMPDPDGPELCRRVRALPAGRLVYAMLLTARTGREEVLAGLRSGADDYLTKPCDPQELFARVQVGERMIGLQESLARRVRDLEEALAKVKQLQTLLPICSYCKSIRSDEDYWQQVEHYISAHAGVRFSHGICPPCYVRMVKPQVEAARHSASRPFLDEVPR